MKDWDYTTSFRIGIWNVDYKGYINTKGKAFGWGTATTEGGGTLWIGTFKGNMKHGLIQEISNEGASTRVGECLNSQNHGK